MQINHNKLKIAIIGGGLSGVSAAWNLADNGHDITIIDKSNRIGGLAKTIRNGEYNYDIGPHNIHTRHENVLHFIKKKIKGNLIEHNPVVEIFFRKRWVPYPLTGIHVFTSINFFTAIACSIDFFLTRIKAFFTKDMGKYDDNYENWIVSRFGRKLYEIYFAPYTEKVWKLHPRELSVEIARKRLIVPSLTELIKAILLKIQPDHPENPNLGRHYYPKNGAQELINIFKEDEIFKKVNFINNATLDSIDVKDEEATSITFLKDGQKESIETDLVLTTIPINELIDSISAELPDEVKEAGKALDYTAMKLLYIHVNKKRVFKQHLAYFSEDEFPFNRIYDVSVWSPAMVPTGKTAICCEITCSFGDETWLLSNDQIYTQSQEVLIKNGFLNADEVEGYHVESISHAYPRFRNNYEKRVKTILEYIETDIHNLVTYGRQGLFSYTNMDDAILMGFKVAAHVNNKMRLEINYEEFFPKYLIW